MIDFLLLDENSFPLAVLEAKRKEKNPLDGKEHARKYAQSKNVRFVILSNGNLHYFWDIDTGKTLIAAAVIKLFLRAGNTKRVLFLLIEEINAKNIKTFK